MLYKFISESKIQECPKNGVVNGHAISNLLKYFEENPATATVEGYKSLTVDAEPEYNQTTQHLTPYYEDGLNGITQHWNVDNNEVIPTIPTKTSDITNDSGYINNTVNDLLNYTKTSDLSEVATSGDYDDLINKPAIPSEVTENTVSGWGFTKNTGTYSKPSGGIPKSDLTSEVTALLDKAATAVQPESGKGLFSGNYNDLTNKPIIPTVDVDKNYVDTELAKKQNVISSVNKVPASYISGLSEVATSGSYNDLNNTPAIPTVGNGTITINQGGIVKGTFTTNQSGNTTISLDGNDVSWGDISGALSDQADLSAELTAIKNGYENISLLISTFSNNDILDATGELSPTSRAIACGEYIEIKEGSSINATISDGYYAKFFFYDANKTFISNSKTRLDASGIVPIFSVNAQYIRFSIKKSDGTAMTVATEYNKCTLSYITAIGKRLTDVENKVEASEGIDDKSLLSSSKAVDKTYEAPVTLLHFSDIHRDNDRVANIVKYYQEYTDIIDDVIATGDLANASFTQYDPIYANAPYNKIMLCIGNHDVYDVTGEHGTASGYDDPAYWATDVQKYNQYFAPSIANWGVTQPANASSNGYCYYYKDYNNKVRLIVLDGMAYTTAQHSWLSSVLTDAISNNLSVAIAVHFIPAESSRDYDLFDTTFSSLKQGMERGYGTDYLTCNDGSATGLVDTFINSNGEFVCWLCGHLHYSQTGVINSHPKQVYVAVDKAALWEAWEDTPRAVGDKTETAFNVVSIDTVNKLIKVVKITAEYDKYLRQKKTLCIDYKNRVLVDTAIPTASNYVSPGLATDNTSTSATKCLTHNMEHRFTKALTSLTLTIPTYTNMPQNYISSVVFISGTTATSIVYPNTIKWSGDDVNNNVFVPAANKTYNLMFWYDGININGIVRGV